MSDHITVYVINTSDGCIVNKDRKAAVDILLSEIDYLESGMDIGETMEVSFGVTTMMEAAYAALPSD